MNNGENMPKKFNLPTQNILGFSSSDCGVSKPNRAKAIQLVRDLRELAFSSNECLVDRVYAQAMGNIIEANFQKKGLKRAKGYDIAKLMAPEVRKTYRKEHPYGGSTPHGDHEAMYTIGKDVALFISQPYGLHMSQMKEMIAFADKWGLRFQISDWPHSHFPGRCLTVLWGGPRTDTLMDTLPAPVSVTRDELAEDWYDRQQYATLS
jgi:hypothetical protein